MPSVKLFDTAIHAQNLKRIKFLFIRVGLKWSIRMLSKE